MPTETMPPERSPTRDPGESGVSGSLVDRRAALAQAIPRRPTVSWWLGIVLALVFAAVVTPAITAEHWLLRFQPGTVAARQEAPFTVRAPMFASYDNLRIRGGVVVARGEVATRDEATIADAIAGTMPGGPMLYIALFALITVLAGIFTHHMRRSIRGRLVRVQVVSLAAIAVVAVGVKLAMVATAVSAVVVPIAVLAMIPTMALDRIVGLATGVLAALVISLLAPFDVGVAILLLVQAATAGLVIAERPKRRWYAALAAGFAATLCTAATYLLLTYLTTGQAPELRDPLHSTWLAAAIGPAVAAVIAVPLLPLYQLLVGEITQGKLFALEDLGHPLLRQIAERSPGTWQHSLMMANMAEIAANAIGASGRLVRVGAYFHDLGKSLHPRYFIENLEPGESSPHDQLPPEVSCDAIFAHVTEGIATARKAGLHERIVDFMHMHHGNGVLEYFWAKCREQGNPNQFTIEQFRYPGHPPQSRETAILAVCDAVEAASRTLKKPDAAAIDALVQRIVYGKLHLGQLDESGLSMSDLRRISDSLRETIRHANHGRIEYPWQKAGQDASASVMTQLSSTPRLDSLDRKPMRDSGAPASQPAPVDGDVALATTADVKSGREPPRALAEPPRMGAEAPAEAEAVRPVSDVPRPFVDVARAIRKNPHALSELEPPSSEADPAGGLPPSAPSPAAGITTIPGRAPGPRLPDAIGAQAFAPEPPVRRATSDPTRTAGPPAPVDLDSAITHPPPLRRGPSGHPPPAAEPAQLAAALASTVARAGAAPSGAPSGVLAAPPRALDGAGDDRPSSRNTLPGYGDVAERLTSRRRARPPDAGPRLPATLVDDADARATLPRIASARVPDPPARVAERAGAHEPDAGITEPSMPALAAGDEARADVAPPGEAEWSNALAERIDAALVDEWATETPIVPPSKAELRALLGQPDPTRQQPIAEIELLQRRAAELDSRNPDAPRRSPAPTAEVDPDDIEAAIELAPPARRPVTANAIGIIKPRPKKPAE